MEIPSHGVVADVEGVISRGYVRVGTALDNECILLAADNVNLGDEQPVDVPGDAPSHVTYGFKHILRNVEFTT